MDLPELLEYRKQRLQALIDLRYEGNKAKLGHAMGFRDGAYINQMLVGRRPITEKAIQKIEELPGARDWFTPLDSPAERSQPPAIALRHAVGTIPEVLAFAKLVKDLSETRRKYLAMLLSDLVMQPEKAGEIAPEIARLLHGEQPGKTIQPPFTHSRNGSTG